MTRVVPFNVNGQTVEIEVAEIENDATELLEIPTMSIVADSSYSIVRTFERVVVTTWLSMLFWCGFYSAVAILALPDASPSTWIRWIYGLSGIGSVVIALGREINKRVNITLGSRQ